MQHSIIIKVGDNFIYQHAQDPKPILEISSSPVDFNKYLPEWEATAKSYIIKPDDLKAFSEFTDGRNLVIGVQVPYDKVEIYQSGDMKFARFSDSPDRSLVSETTNNQHPTKNPQMQGAYVEKVIATPVKKKENGVAELVLNVNEDGDVSLKFIAHQNPTDLEGKLLNAFLKKAKEKGLVLTIPKLTETEAEQSEGKGFMYELKLSTR